MSKYWGKNQNWEIENPARCKIFMIENSFKFTVVFQNKKRWKNGYDFRKLEVKQNHSMIGNHDD
jgi:hypothetical protein